MAKKIQAWAAYGPKIALGDPMKKEELIENIIAATNQSRGSCWRCSRSWACRSRLA